jgi:hypothetical protein
MAPARPHPELWQPIAQVLLALRALLRAASPDSFAVIAARVCRELRLSGALVRRYLFALARDIALPPLCVPPTRNDPYTRNQAVTPGRRTSRFDPGERPAARRAAPASTPPDPAPAVQWALALNAAEALLAVLRDPLPAARRLAFRLARDKSPPLRELPVPAHILRAVHPALDALLMRLDALARPDAWAGMHPDTG